MTGLLICAAVVAGFSGWLLATVGAYELGMTGPSTGKRWAFRISLALIAVALWLAYAAGGAA